MSYNPEFEVSYLPALADLLIKNYNPDCTFAPRTAFVFDTKESKDAFLIRVANNHFTEDTKKLQDLIPPHDELA